MASAPPTEVTVRQARPLILSSSLITPPTDDQQTNGTLESSSAAKYALSIDEIESKRLDLQHHLFYLTLDGKLHLAPLSADLHNVLDIGTGTGIWAIDFAKLHPKTKVIGSDASGFERPESFIRDDLPNLSFGE